MARDLIKFKNTKGGFVTLLVLEGVLCVWALTATLYALKVGRTRTVVYGFVTMFAIFYIFGRSLRSFRGLVKREKEEKAQEQHGNE